MLIFRCTATLVLLLSALLNPIQGLFGVPPLPSSLYGTVQWNGENLPKGTLIQALIEDKIVGECTSLTYEDQSVYAIDIPGDDPSTPGVEGGVEGALIRFMVAGQLADETGIWRGGVNTQLNLTVNTAVEPEPPQPSPTPPATQTPIVTNAVIRSSTPIQTTAALSTPTATETEPQPVSQDPEPTTPPEKAPQTDLPTRTQAEPPVASVDEHDPNTQSTDTPQTKPTSAPENQVLFKEVHDARPWRALTLGGLTGFGLLIIGWLVVRKRKQP